ncbi:cell wall-active antibiotics response protein LiaF [Bacillus sp. X1(2014)]|uniref:cell wall-active antibiotics response protein LiaF n=1 Tax=Bacillus sp. X1(2014) TaxID=1565991 RepID=UPI0011AAEFAD|nr:cell wall-active antibiotics response protein LiaF [Bacillus sp. X1(2014)]
MFKNTKYDYLGWMFIIGAIILVMEILFFNSGLIFSLIISGGMIFLGRKRTGKKRGKILFIGGIIFFVISVLNMMTFRFFLLAILLHFFIQFINSKKHPKKISPEIILAEETVEQETLIKTEPLFENIVLGQQKTPAGAYKWNDVNIQAGIGDTIIDLSFTMLPKGETVIFIRNLVGNIQILVPYDIEVSIQHSCIVGSTSVFEHHDSKLFNRVLHVKTPGYEAAEHKVKIFTSLVVGNLEVSRI